MSESLKPWLIIQIHKLGFNNEVRFLANLMLGDEIVKITKFKEFTKEKTITIKKE